MPAGGVWWINADREEDAISLVNQTIASQSENAKVAVAGMGYDLQNILRLESDRGPKKYNFFPCQVMKKVYTFSPAIYFVLLNLRIIYSFCCVQITPGRIFRQRNYTTG
jgi:hypothetical protein